MQGRRHGAVAAKVWVLKEMSREWAAGHCVGLSVVQTVKGPPGYMGGGRRVPFGFSRKQLPHKVRGP